MKNDFEKIIPDVKKYIRFGPKIHKSYQWNTKFVQLKYKGMIIEFDDAYNTQIFDQKTKRWIKIKYDLSKAQRKKIYGMIIPVIPKNSLLKRRTYCQETLIFKT